MLAQPFPGFYDASKPDPRPTETKLKDEYLTCVVCKHVFDFGKYAPHQLPCGDTACLDCLRQYAGRKGKADEMHCPVCDRLIVVPGGHVCCFPPDAGTLKILEVFKLVEAHKKDFVPCIGCDEKAEARCLECQENYCDEHANFHSIVAATKHHTVVKFMDILAEPQKILRANGAQFCSKHYNSALEAVCTTCNALCCLVCAITDHKGHSVKEIGDTMSNIHDKMRPLMKRVEQNSYNIKQNLKIAEDVDKEMNIMFQRCKRDLNISFMGVVRGSRDRQNELFAEVNHVLGDNVKLLEKQIHDIEDEINFTIRGQDMLNDIFQEYSPAQIAGIGGLVQKLIDDVQTIPEDLPIEPLPTMRVTFESKTEQDFYVSGKKFGSLKISEIKMSLIPKDPKEIDFESDEEEEEEELLPIDNSELSQIVKEQMAPVAT